MLEVCIDFTHVFESIVEGLTGIEIVFQMFSMEPKVEFVGTLTTRIYICESLAQPTYFEGRQAGTGWQNSTYMRDSTYMRVIRVHQNR